MRVVFINFSELFFQSQTQPSPDSSKLINNNGDQAEMNQNDIKYKIQLTSTIIWLNTKNRPTWTQIMLTILP